MLNKCPLENAGGLVKKSLLGYIKKLQGMKLTLNRVVTRSQNLCRRALVHVCVSENVYRICLLSKLIKIVWGVCVYIVLNYKFLYTYTFILTLLLLCHTFLPFFLSFKKRGIESNRKLSKV